jgi:hypothetical protein
MRLIKIPVLVLALPGGRGICEFEHSSHARSASRVAIAAFLVTARRDPAPGRFAIGPNGWDRSSRSAPDITQSAAQGQSKRRTAINLKIARSRTPAVDLPRVNTHDVFF